MFGRVLFALVWLIIAAGVALPLYPRDVPESTVAVATGPVQLVAAAGAGCEDCPVSDAGRTDCGPNCPCLETRPAVFVPLEEPLGLTISVTERLLPPRRPGPPVLPAKLPAI